MLDVLGDRSYSTLRERERAREREANTLSFPKQRLYWIVRSDIPRDVLQRPVLPCLYCLYYSVLPVLFCTSVLRVLRDVRRAEMPSRLLWRLLRGYYARITSY